MQNHPTPRQSARRPFHRSPRSPRLIQAAGGALLALLLTVAAHLSAQAQEPEALPAVVLNELHVQPRLETERLEFVELYNPSAATVDLGGWSLRGGIDYAFPAGLTLPPQSYLVVAENPDALRAAYQTVAAGPFTGNLSLEGERVTLRNAAAETVDELTYGHGFPWPTGGEDRGASLQLINPALDNAMPGAWRSATPSPGRANSVYVTNAPPLVESVAHEPQQPRPGQPVTIRVRAQDANGIASVRLAYQVVAPGAYIARSDPAYTEQWTWLDMQPEENGLYAAVLPASLQQSRTLVRYRIEAGDVGGRSLTLPYADDPQPNFAYFVYGELPAWSGSIDGGATDVERFDFASMRALPVYFFLAKQSDVADALFLPPSERGGGYTGSDYLWQGTFVYEGRVYDHVGFRARGGAYRYVTGKTHWKINFKRGHRLQVYDDYGQPAAVLRDKLILSAVMQRGFTRQRGESGLYESAAFRLFNLAGVPAPNTHFAHLRVIDAPAELGPTQYEGDFWGLYLALEQMDGRFLDEHDLPEGNLYKMDVHGPDLNSLGRNGPTDSSDIRTFLATFPHYNLDTAWWRANVDLDGYYSYRSIIEFTHHYDIDALHNYFYFSNPDTGRWSVLPWDADLTWWADAPGTGVEPFLTTLLARPEFQVEYRNRLRALRDLLLNPEQIGLLLAEQARVIDTPADGPSIVDANRALWDFNPILSSRYVAPLDALPGAFYSAFPGRAFPGVVEAMTGYAQARMAWIDQTLLAGDQPPATPTIRYAGASGFPADGVRFGASEFAAGASGAGFAAQQWRLAEITDPAAVDPATPVLYEIDAVWESAALRTARSTIAPPNGTVQPGRTYRARVRYQDDAGIWSHWSEPLTFVASAPAAPARTTLHLTEIMYHPRTEQGRTEKELEFVELHNPGDSPIDLSGMALVGAVDYAFTATTTLAPGAYLVVAGEPDALFEQTGVIAVGKFDGSLDNAGETLTLLDVWARPLISVAYSDDDPWPRSADGDGYSLVPLSSSGSPADPASWRASTAIGGSPGAYDAQPVVINELLLLPAEARAVELYNPGALPVDIGNWFLGATELRARVLQLPEGTVIPPGGLLTIDAGSMTELPLDGGTLLLSSGDAGRRVTGYQQGAHYGPAEPGVSWGRHLDSRGRAWFVALQAATLGSANAAPRVGPVVISALDVRPGSGSDSSPEFIELTNTSDQPVALYDPAAPERQWQISGGFYALPAGIELPAHGRLLVVSGDPERACPALAGGYTRIVGPLAAPLSDFGEEVALLRPVATGAGYGWLPVDSVEYATASPWPELAPGRLLRRTRLDAFGSDPAHWQAAAALDPSQSAQSAATVALCSFGARPDAAARQVTLTWWTAGAPPGARWQLWRGTTLDRSAAVPVATLAADARTDAAQPATALGSYVDANIDTSRFWVYWLEMVDAEGTVTELGITSLQRSYQRAFLPILTR